MTDNELIIACNKQDKAAEKQLFERYFGNLSYIARRYSKNNLQANQLFSHCFNEIYCDLRLFDTTKKESLDKFIAKKFIEHAIEFIKNIRSEYYVASTVKASENTSHTYDLFVDNTFVEFNKIEREVLLKSLQELVPSQRLVFNLAVIDENSMTDISKILETSEYAIKANLEKARFNLQRNIEKNVKSTNHEQAF